MNKIEEPGSSTQDTTIISEMISSILQHTSPTTCRPRLETSPKQSAGRPALSNKDKKTKKREKWWRNGKMMNSHRSPSNTRYWTKSGFGQRPLPQEDSPLCQIKSVKQLDQTTTNKIYIYICERTCHPVTWPSTKWTKLQNRIQEKEKQQQKKTRRMTRSTTFHT